jgi:hypothetical protein
MYKKIDSINQILPNTDTTVKIWKIQTWNGTVLRTKLLTTKHSIFTY